MLSEVLAPVCLSALFLYAGVVMLLEPGKALSLFNAAVAAVHRLEAHFGFVDDFEEPVALEDSAPLRTNIRRTGIAVIALCLVHFAAVMTQI
jgi:hypothetical protein